MHCGLIGDGWQREAASSQQHAPSEHVGSDRAAIRHRVTDTGASIDLADVDDLQASVICFGEALLSHALNRVSLTKGSVTRRAEIVRCLSQAVGALPIGQGGEIEVFDAGRSITIPLPLGGGQAVVFVVQLRWADAVRPLLSEIVCHSQINVSDREREENSVWLRYLTAQLKAEPLPQNAATRTASEGRS
ncbi:hypothetical protein [Brevundimonas diminuta]|uniref:hypothetical protein n=1 Tax=Brevundimonas diminuta TaxID=293 RepID=UPI003D9A5FA0